MTSCQDDELSTGFIICRPGLRSKSLRRYRNKTSALAADELHQRRNIQCVHLIAKAGLRSLHVLVSFLLLSTKDRKVKCSIELYANETPASVAWRGVPDNARESIGTNQLCLMHYHDPQVTRREKIAITDSSSYVVASARSHGRTTAFSNGHQTHNGATQPGMVHVAQPGDVVRGILERPSDAYYLHIPVKLWANFCDEHKTSSAALPELRPVHFESNHQLHALLQTIEHDVTSPHAIGPLFREGLCLSVMALLRDRYSSESNAARPAGCSGMGAKQIKHVHEFIQANLDQPISLAQLAGIAGYSRMHFAVVFRQITGMRPHEYLTRARVERSRSLLLNSSLTIAQIAAAVGFSSQSHLTAVFRNVMGVTPAYWRAVEGRRRLGTGYVAPTFR